MSKDNGGPASDRELLEMAAKAIHAPENYANKAYMGGWFSWWNPLTDDGDALRLAVKLQLLINIDIDGALVEMQVKDDNAWASEFAHDGDLYAATRRAIVRAAAAIGSAM